MKSYLEQVRPGAVEYRLGAGFADPVEGPYRRPVRHVAGLSRTAEAFVAHPVHFRRQGRKVDARLDLGQRIAQLVELRAVVGIGEQVGFDGTASCHRGQVRLESGTGNFTGSRHGEVFRGAPAWLSCYKNLNILSINT